MTTEDRVTLLEQSHATLNRVVSELVLHSRDIDHNVTILLGTIGSQGLDIRELKGDIAAIKTRLDGIETHLATVDLRMAGMESSMDTQFAAVHQRLDVIVALLGGGQP